MIKAPFNLSPDDRIKTITHSLRCFMFGAASAVPMLVAPLVVLLVVKVEAPYRLAVVACAGWLPLFSLTLSVMAWSNQHKASAACRGEWNPARAQLIWGRSLSAMGVFFSLMLLLFLAGALLNIFDQ